MHKETLCPLLRRCQVGTNLELPVVQFVAVFEEELVRRPEARLHAVLHDGARARRARQFLDLVNTERERGGLLLY